MRDNDVIIMTTSSSLTSLWIRSRGSGLTLDFLECLDPCPSSIHERYTDRLGWQVDRRTHGQTRYLDALVVDSDIVQLKPHTFYFDLWGHSGGWTGHLGGRQDWAALWHLRDRQVEAQTSVTKTVSDSAQLVKVISFVGLSHCCHGAVEDQLLLCREESHSSFAFHPLDL